MTMLKDETVVRKLDAARERLHRATDLYNNDLELFRLRYPVTVTFGNSKTGKCMMFSTAAGITCPNCAGCINYCYALRIENRFPETVLKNHVANTANLFTDMDDTFSVLWDIIAENQRKYKFFRWHESGEIFSRAYFEKIVETARLFPGVTFWTYTKNYSVVNAWIRDNGSLPENLKIMFSAGFNPVENPYNLPLFYCVKTGENAPTGFYKCPGNCDYCKQHKTGCIAGVNTLTAEH